MMKYALIVFLWINNQGSGVAVERLDTYQSQPACEAAAFIIEGTQLKRDEPDFWGIGQIRAICIPAGTK